MTTLQGRANSKGTPASFSWDAMSRMAQNSSGNMIDYETFKAEYDANPMIQDVVQSFNDRGIVLKTKNKADMPLVGQEKKTGAVDAMAKRATAKAINR